MRSRGRRYHLGLISGTALTLGAGLIASCGASKPEGAPVSTPTAGSATSATSPPSDRPGLIRYIEKLIATGEMASTTEAIGLINERFSTDEIREDTEIHGLLERAIAADKSASAPSKAAEYAERVESYWLPKLRAIETTAPDEAPALWQRVSAIEEVVRGLSDGSEFKVGPSRAARLKLAAAIRMKQAELFPVLRRAYGEITRRTLWSLDVEVATAGPATRVIKFTGARFAANSNIASAQTTVSLFLQKLRFTKSSYEWVNGSGGYSYTLNSPKDQDIGVWDGEVFKVTPE